IEILLSALVPCPRIASTWLILESNWFSRSCLGAWFSFAGTWLPESLARLRTMRSRDANRLIASWLLDPSPHLVVECDYDERIPRYRALCDSRALLTRTLRLRIISTPDGVTRPADERDQQTRADHLRALATMVLEDRVGARPPDPPTWREPAGFLYF